MLIYLIRHGETEFNQEQRYQGSLDISLSEAGRAALRRAEFSPDVVYTSHMKRAKETAQRIFPAATLVPIRDLREMSFGDYEGRSKGELTGDPDYEAWLGSGFAGDCPNTAERHEVFVDRTCRAFSELVEQGITEGKERLVIVAHGGTQMAVLSTFADEMRLFGGWLTKNAEGYILDTKRWSEEKKLTVVNRISFLKE